MSKKKWIQDVVKPGKEGRFHKQLEINQKDRIPKTLVKKIMVSEIDDTISNPTKTGKKRIKVTKLLKQRANFALNVGYKKKK